MKASFIKRLSAFLIDSFIISLFFSIVTIGSDSGIDIENSKIIEFQNKIENGEILEEDILNEYSIIFYDIQKSSIIENIVSIVLYVGYFIVFAYMNNGQTIGKKILNIRVINNNDNKLSIWNMILRNIFIYGICTMMFSVVFINIININLFVYVYLLFTYIEFLIIVLSFFMILYKKDGRGIHDMIAKTNVIEEVR